MNVMAESAVTLVKSWTREIESDGGVSDIEIDEYLNRFSVDVISRACFGNNYSKGEEIFLKLRDLQQIMSKKAVYHGLHILRFDLFSHSNILIQNLCLYVTNMITSTLRLNLTFMCHICNM